MSILKCKMCGGDINLSADRTIGTCEYCGSTTTLPKIDDDQRAAAFNRGNHFRRIGEFDKALAVYERIVQEDENDAEAHWCCALCRFGIEYVEDPNTYEWIPTCHRASFDSFLEDVDYLAAVDCSNGVTRRQYQKDGAKIAEVQKGILATSQNTEPYDVFICYKESDENGNRTVDSTLAQDIYYQLTEQGHKVFFARITLEDVVGAQYEPYIFAALNSAKVMVVVGTKAEYLNAVWVKNEWSRFLSIVKKDRSKVILPCYRDMDPYDMPEQLSVLQSYDMSKIGFMQDLIRGIGKVVTKEKKQETVVVKTETNGSAAAFLKRGNLALEDGDWNSANDFFEKALNNDPECGEAYFGKLLAENRKMGIDLFQFYRLKILENVKPTTVEISIDKEKYDELYKKYFVENFSNKKDFSYILDKCKTEYQILQPNISKLQSDEQDYWEEDKNLSKAVRFATGEFKEKLNKVKREIENKYNESLNIAVANDEKNKQQAYAELDKLVAEVEEKLAELQKEEFEKIEKLYATACEKQSKITLPKDCADVISDFQRLGDYKDSKTHVEQCKKLAVEEKKKKMTITSICASVAVVIIAAVLVITKVVIPNNNYKKAQQLFADGKYNEAIAAFEELGDYKDSVNIKNEIRKKIANNRDTTISAGLSHTVGLKSDGTVVAVGYNDDGQCNVSDWKDIVAIFAGDYYTVGLKSDGTVVAVGDNDYGQCDVSGWKDIVAISAGGYHTVGLKSDGTVVAVGRNDYGQCDVSDWKDIIAISAGDFHTVGLKSDGTVVAVGYNGDGRCNVSDWKYIIAISAGSSHTVGLQPDGTVVAVGNNKYGRCIISDWKDIIAISAGDYHTVGLQPDGTVVAVGNNINDQCDVSGWKDIVAISARRYHTVGLKSDGTVVAVGYNGYGRCNVSGWEDIKVNK